MSETTQRTVNGWPVLTGTVTGHYPRLRRFVIPGANRHLMLRDGSAGFILVHFALWWDEVISPLDGGVWDEWGWAPPRPVRGMTRGFSNHCSGTAADLDATQYPRGIRILSRFKPVQVRLIRRRLRLYADALTWGGDFARVPDGMHVEVGPGVTLGHCERVARRLMDTPRGRRILAANPGVREVIES